MEEFEDLDIYNDLDEFQAVEDKKSKELLDLEAKYQQSLETNELLKLENKQLQKKIKTLEVNFQNLLDTAKAEIQRKNKLIDELRKEKDDICFRRNNTQNPFKTARPERQNSSDEKSARSQHNGRMRQQDEHTEIKVASDEKKDYERKTQKIEEKAVDNHIFSRRDDKRLPRRECRERDRTHRRRSRSRNRRSRSRSRSREIHKSNVDARSIINSKAKRKYEHENVAKEAKRTKIVEPTQEKHVNEKNGSSDKNVGDHTQKVINDSSVDSVEETLKKVANSIENIVEELKKEAPTEKTDIQPTTEQKESHSFDDYLELFAETDLSDAETPVNTPLKKENANVLLSDLCEPIESEEEIEDIQEMKNSEKEKHKSHERKKDKKTEEQKIRLSEAHKNLFGESDEDEDEEQAKNKDTSPNKSKENTDKEKELRKSPSPQQLVEEISKIEQEMPEILQDVENLTEKEHQLKDIEEVLISIENEHNNNIETSQCLMQDIEEKLLVKETLMETTAEVEATVMDTPIEDSSVSKKLMDNIFGNENNHSWLGFKIPKVNAKTENKMEEETKVQENKTEAKTRPRIRRRKVTVVKKVDNEDTTSSVENIKEDENKAETTDIINETTKTDDSEIISPKTSALLDEIFEKTVNVEPIVEPNIPPQCSPIAADSDVELRMRNIFQSPLQTATVANDRPTIISNINLTTNNNILDLMLETPQNVTLEQPANLDSLNLSEISADTGSATMNSSTETKEMVMGSSKYVFEKVSDNTVHLFITRSKGRRRKKVATQLPSPISVPTMET